MDPDIFEYFDISMNLKIYLRMLKLMIKISRLSFGNKQVRTDRN